MTGASVFPFPVGARGEPPAEYAELHRRSGLCPVRLANGRDALLAGRFADVRQVLSDSRFSRSAYTGGSLFARSADSLPLITTDGSVHARRRAAVAHAFTARRVRAMRPTVQEILDRQIAELAGGTTPVDLVSRFTVPFTLRVMCRLLGVPDEDNHRFTAWVDPIMSMPGRVSAEEIAEGHRELQGYFARLADTTQAAIGEGRRPAGLIADMLTAEPVERRLSRTEIVVLSAGLLVAGYETTSNEMAAALYEVLRRPRLVDRVRRDPDAIAPIAEEVMRYLCANGSGGVPHVATTDVTLSDGTVVPAGTVVVPLPDAANRDPAVFADPDRVDPDRAGNVHLALGYGAHRCLGAELARLEMYLGMAAVLRSFPGLRIAVPDDELRWRTDMYVRGPWQLPVTW